MTGVWGGGGGDSLPWLSGMDGAFDLQIIAFGLIMLMFSRGGSKISGHQT